MIQETELIKTKLGLLNWVEHLSNVKKACKIMGYSRDSFYRIKQLYDTGGEAALQEVSKVNTYQRTVSPLPLKRLL